MKLVTNQVREQIIIEVRKLSQAYNLARDKMGDQVRIRVINQVHNQVWDKVYTQVRDQINNKNETS